MATDNRTHELFPDVIENYGPADFGGDLNVPTTPEPYDGNVEVAAYDDVALPVVPVGDPLADTGEHADHQYSAIAVEPVEDDYPVDDSLTDEKPESDPYAHGPDWVRAHIPRGPVGSAAQSRRGLSTRIRRPTKPAPDPVAPPEDHNSDTPTRRRAGKPVMWLIGGGTAALVAVAVGVSVGTSGDVVDTTAAQSPSVQTAEPKATAAAAPTWCEDSDSGGVVTGRGPGDPATGPGLILAFDHAYYVQHDSAKVASMMLRPNPADSIQKSIDDAASADTEHCVTITATPDPNVFEVELELRSDSGPEGTVKQRISVAGSAAGLKVDTLEELPA